MLAWALTAITHKEEAAQPGDRHSDDEAETSPSLQVGLVEELNLGQLILADAIVDEQLLESFDLRAGLR